ncbi:DUF6629 family protein [Streptomyces sp. NPDC091278]|uniref:DUF6629 family protein n=1 Tax=Streptomyces sp. NPDC091278 TaxID=3155301 RepID=UPI00344D0EB4
MIGLPLLPLWVPLGVLTASRPADRRRPLVPLAAGNPEPPASSPTSPPTPSRPRSAAPPAATPSARPSCRP